jgi:hypothetical protein
LAILKFKRWKTITRKTLLVKYIYMAGEDEDGGLMRKERRGGWWGDAA